jgi:competence protein ComEC
LFLLAIGLILAGIICNFQSQKLKIIFFNVGQGDAILIEKGLNQILIDGGPSGKVELEKLGKYMPFWDRKIELIIATHPDKDHILGLAEVMENYKIGAVIDNGLGNDSATFQKYLDVIDQKNIQRLKGERKMQIKFGEAKIEIFYPEKNMENNFADTNAGSIVARLIFGKNSFLFTGDFPTQKEFALISSSLDLNSRVLKVAHHGSKNSTSSEFLNKVNPIDAIIPVGKNSYGHPTEEVLQKLKAKNVNIFRTDEKGDIKYICPDINYDCEIRTEF